MTLTHLQIFIKVYQQENITRAAQLLNMTQPAVSRAIKELEQYYNVRLFERINRRLSRTECANQLYAQAIHVEDSVQKMEEQLYNWGEMGTLRIGATISFGNFFIPDLVATFGQQFPNCNIQVRIANGQQLQEDLKNNRLDFALIEGGVFDHNLHATPFVSDCLQLIVPPSHPWNGKTDLSISQLEHCKLLAREPGSAGRMTAEQCFTRHHLHITPIWESNSTQAIVRAVHLGIGIALLPEHLVIDAIRQGFVGSCRIENETFSRQNFLVWHKHKFLTTAATAFIELCQSTYHAYQK